MSVIGFLTYEDFLKEIQEAGVKTVRLQDYHRRQDVSGLPWLDFYIDLAAVRGEETYVARFALGGAWDMEMDHHRQGQARENAAKAVEFLRRDLEARGLRVRPGLIAAVADVRVITDAPWRWEKDGQGLPVLVAGGES